MPTLKMKLRHEEVGELTEAACLWWDPRGILPSLAIEVKKSKYLTSGYVAGVKGKVMCKIRLS